VPDLWRAQQTADKIRRAGLPGARGHRRKVGTGDGMPCHGCSDTITEAERMHSVRFGDTLNFRFHTACYTAWRSFPQRQIDFS